MHCIRLVFDLSFLVDNLQILLIIFLILNNNIPSIQKLQNIKSLTAINLQHLLQQRNKLITKIILPDRLIEVVIAIFNDTLLYIVLGALDVTEALLREEAGHFEDVLHFCVCGY